MSKALEYDELDLSERRSVERVVGRYRASGMSRTEFVRRLSMLGYERVSAERYVDLVESTLDGFGSGRPRQYPLRRWSGFA